MITAAPTNHDTTVWTIRYVVADIWKIRASEMSEAMICSTPHTTEPTRHSRATRASAGSTQPRGTRSPMTRASSGRAERAEATNATPMMAVITAGATR